MRKLTLALLVALPIATLVTVTAQSPTAQARSVADLSPNQMVDASELIVRGTVSEVWTEKDAAGSIWTLASVEVERVYKGESATRSVIVHQLGGSESGEGLTLSVFTRFSPGEQTLLYLDKSNSGLWRVVGGDIGKFTVRIDPDNGREMLVRATVGQEWHYDHRFIPHPPQNQRVYADDVEAQIQARVAQGWDGKPIPGASLDRLERINTVPAVGQQ
jgi:hypothetical protein